MGYTMKGEAVEMENAATPLTPEARIEHLEQLVSQLAAGRAANTKPGRFKRLWHSPSFALGAFCALFVGAVGTSVAWGSRNSAGTMSIPNTFVAGTSISSASVNANFSDIGSELTNSLERNGKGGMLASLRGIDGTLAAPAFSWTSESGSGLFRNGTSDVRMSISATAAQQWTTAAVLPLLPLRAAAGLVSAPSLSFAAETNTGWYRNAAGDIRFAVAGTDKQFSSATGFGVGAAPGTLIDAEGAHVALKGLIYAKGIGGHGMITADTDTPVTKQAGFAINKNGVEKWEIYTPANSNDLRIFDGTADRVTIANGGVVTFATGIAVDGGGFKHASVAGCTTAAAVGATCSSTVSWATAFADANYHVFCGCNGSTGVPVVTSYSGIAASVGITTAALTASAATCTNISCVGVHN